MIEIKPAPRSNPEGRDDLPWNIWKDGRNTNVKPNKAAAEKAAGITPFDKMKGTGRVLGPNPITEKDPMTVVNKDAPAIGTKVTEHLLDKTQVTGTVVEHLSTQFIIETTAGNRRIICNKGDWEYGTAQ